MKRVSTSICLAMLCAAGLAAQTQADDQRRKADPARSDEKSVTIVGCLRAGDMPNTFVLENVKDESAASMPSSLSNPATPPTEPPSTPTTPPTPPPTQPTTPDPSSVGTSGAMSGPVRLIGAPASLDLSKHIGHTVAITGSWAPASKSAQPTGTTGTEKAAGAEKKSLNVKSMAHRSDTCK